MHNPELIYKHAKSNDNDFFKEFILCIYDFLFPCCILQVISARIDIFYSSKNETGFYVTYS